MISAEALVVRPGGALYKLGDIRGTSGRFSDLNRTIDNLAAEGQKSSKIVH